MRYWLPVLLWAGVIFLFSTLQATTTTEFFLADFILKKTAHMVEYAILTILLYRAFKENGTTKRKAAVYSVIISAIYAGTDEYHQSFTPGRQPTVRDVIFDTIGASLGIYTIWKLLPKAPKRLKIWAKNFQLI